MKRASNGHQADPPKPRGIQGRIEPVGREVPKRKMDRRPVRTCGEMSAVGLPRTDIVRSAEVNGISLSIAPHDEPDPGVSRHVDGSCRFVQVEYCLEKTAVVLETDVAGEAKALMSIDGVVGDEGLRDPAHDAVTDSTPSRAELGDEISVAKIVDQHGTILTRKSMAGKRINISHIQCGLALVGRNE
jgi:hypothetical protein